MKCDNLFVYSGLFMLIYTRIFLLLVGWLAGWEFFSFIFIYLLFQNKIRIQRVQFDIWSMCVVYECGAYFFWMQARYPLSLIDTSSPISLAKLWLWMNLKPVFNFKATQSVQCLLGNRAHFVLVVELSKRISCRNKYDLT